MDQVQVRDVEREWHAAEHVGGGARANGGDALQVTDIAAYPTSLQ